MHKVSRFFLPTFILCCLLLGCCTKSRSSPHEKPLKVVFNAEVTILDPRSGIDNPTTHVIKHLFEGLMRVGLDGKPKEALAESYEVSEDKLKYTFHLRESYWSNGDPVTAHDFVYTWRSAVNPKLKSTGAYYLYLLKNAQAIIEGHLPSESLGVSAPDDKTLIVELENPHPCFLEIVSTTIFYPVNSRLDKENPSWVTQDNHQFVCNGPFLLEKHLPQNKIVLKKNPNFWDAKQVPLPEIEIIFITDSITQLYMFEKGEIDWFGKPFSSVPLDALPTLKKEQKINVIPAANVSCFFLNTESPPLNNQKIRKALALAINREEIAEHFLLTNEQPACAIIPPLFGLKQTNYFKDHDLELAQQLFAEGLKELNISKEQFPKLTIRSPSLAVWDKLAQILQSQWAKNLGVWVKIESQEWKVHFANLQQGAYQIGGMGWYFTQRDPLYLLQIFYSKNDKLNIVKWENSEYKSLVDVARKESDWDKRNELLSQAEKMVLDEMLVIPIYFNTFSYCKNEKLKDVYFSELCDIDFRWAYFED